MGLFTIRGSISSSYFSFKNEIKLFNSDCKSYDLIVFCSCILILLNFFENWILSFPKIVVIEKLSGNFGFGIFSLFCSFIISFCNTNSFGFITILFWFIISGYLILTFSLINLLISNWISLDNILFLAVIFLSFIDFWNWIYWILSSKNIEKFFGKIKISSGILIFSNSLFFLSW